jgi:uncharacterized protein (DUF1786 family)
LEEPESILALDIGSGTQDLFLWQEGQVVENCVQMVLPSPTTTLARCVREATREGVPLHLTGHLMGGGPVAWAIRDHALAGLVVSAEPDAALTLHDNLDHVREMGVRIQERPPDNARLLSLGDIQRELLESTLTRFGLALPEVWCVAVQDHGHQPHASNRAFRFVHWQNFLAEGGKCTASLYADPPGYLTRMRAVRAQLPRGFVMDTGMAAIHGAACDPWIRSRLDRGVLVVNLGNQHILAGLILGERVWGIFEHHTGALSSSSLKRWMDRFRGGELRSPEVLEDGGHGCAYSPDPLPSTGFESVAVTGPQRELARTLGWTLAAPFGNMMLSGSFGLVRACLLAHGRDWP